MARDPASPLPQGGSLVFRPWVVLAAGLGVAGLGWLAAYSSLIPIPIRLGLVFGATLIVLGAVIRRLRQASLAFPERVESAAIISLAGLAALLGYLAMDEDWDSGRMLYGALFLLSLGGTVLIVLPSLLRRILISLFIVFHFCGLGVAITSVDPPGGTGSWLSKQLWTWVYRPYLSFLYLTNAYHFYSPDPGPPGLLWFAVYYDDGTYTWVKLPDRGNSPIGMHYQRMLALPEHSFTALPRLPFTALELQLTNTPVPERGSWEEIYHRRELGTSYLFPTQGAPEGKQALPIPMVQDFDALVQYREPSFTSKKLIAAIAKRIIWTTPKRKDGASPKTVKVYRLVHQILSPYELSTGVSPLEKTKHLPYFLGEFDRQGRLVDPRDPFLYWYLPIALVPENYPDHGLYVRPTVPAIFTRGQAPKGGFLLDCLEMHAAGRITRK